MLDLGCAALFLSKPNLVQPFSLRVRDLLERANVDIKTVLKSWLPVVPPWTTDVLIVDLGLHTGNKSSTNPLYLKTKFYWYTAVNPGFIHIFTDGSKDKDDVSSAAVCRGQTSTLRLPSAACFH